MFLSLLLKMVRDGKIVGLKGSSNGRACVQHACCGISLWVNDLLHFKVGVVIQEDGTAETVVKAVDLINFSWAYVRLTNNLPLVL